MYSSVIVNYGPLVLPQFSVDAAAEKEGIGMEWIDTNSLVEMLSVRGSALGLSFRVERRSIHRGLTCPGLGSPHNL